MQVDVVIDLVREVVMQCLTVAGPPLAMALFVGLVVGFLQAITQIQDASISIIPRIFAILLTLAVMAPWFLSRMMEFSQRMFGSLPTYAFGP